MNTKALADIFTRYIMGDREIAISQLKDFKETIDASNLSTSDYNKTYGALYLDINAALTAAQTIISLDNKKV